MFARLIANWVYGGFLAGLLLLLLVFLSTLGLFRSSLRFSAYRFTWSTNSKSTTTTGSDCSSIRRLGKEE